VCPTRALAPGEHARQIDHDGNTRDYEIQIPADYDNTSAVPLVLDLHGYSNNAAQQQGISGFAALAEQEGFIVARPEGTGVLQSWNGGDACCGSAQSQGLDDVGLMRAIVLSIAAEACVDPRRVYATGLSNGGALSHRLACEAADMFAAVAPVSYPIDFDPFSKCQPSRPIAVIHSHGTDDIVIPYNGGFTAAPAPDSFDYWGMVNGCTGDPVETFQSGSSHCDSYETCGAGVKVTLCTINGGHVLYNNNDNVSVTDLAWQFLSAYTLP
jgi:polyhydroxybutyrate depolymerase